MASADAGKTSALRGLLRDRHVTAVRHLLTGSAMTAGISLLSMALAARALGPQAFGVLALIIALSQACERLVSFQSWQPVIRYGAPLDSTADAEGLRILFKFGLALDIAGSVVAWIVASGLALAGHWLFHISAETTGLALLYVVSLLFNLNGMATAVFRMFNRFRIVARLQVATAIVRLIASAIAFAAGQGVLGFVLIWAATQALGSLLSLIVALVMLHRRRLGDLVRAPLRGLANRFPGIWRFTWGANASLTLWSSAQQVDVLLVGWLADPASAGFFHIAKRVSRIIQQVGSQVEAVVYPDLSRLWAAGERRKFLLLLLRTEAVLAAYGLGCFLFLLLSATTLFRLTAGERFVGAAPILSVQVFAVALTVSGAASRAGLLAMGRQPAILKTVTACTLSFYCLAPLLIAYMGAMGASVAHLIFGAIWLGGLSLNLRRGLAAEAERPVQPVAA
jgi:O-antigen/teichoic acid export membrane protein